MSRLPSSVAAKLEEWEREGQSGELRLLYNNGHIHEVVENIKTRVERPRPAPRLLE